MTGPEPAAVLALLADLDVYVSQGHLVAAVELLEDEATALLAARPTALKALSVIAVAIADHVKEHGDNPEAARALEAWFAFASRIDERIANIAPERLAMYRRALIASQTAAVPLPRVLRHVELLRCLESTAALQGAVVECGVAKGLSFLHLCFDEATRRAGWRGAGFVVVDSFEGLSEPGIEDRAFEGLAATERRRVESMTQAGYFAFDFETVSRRIWDRFPDVAIHRGWIPPVFGDMPERRYRFVHVDVDLYAPTLAAFEYFVPRLVSGGIIATDDYNWPGGRQAVDEACQRFGLTLHTTDTSFAHAVIR